MITTHAINSNRKRDCFKLLVWVGGCLFDEKVEFYMLSTISYKFNVIHNETMKNMDKLQSVE